MYYFFKKIGNGRKRIVDFSILDLNGWLNLIDLLLTDQFVYNITQNEPIGNDFGLYRLLNVHGCPPSTENKLLFIFNNQLISTNLITMPVLN